VLCDASIELGQSATCTLLNLGCCGEGLTCYWINAFYAQCLPTGACEANGNDDWDCTELNGHDPECRVEGQYSWFESCQDNPTGCSACNFYGQRLACYRKNSYYSQCLVVGHCPPWLFRRRGEGEGEEGEEEEEREALSLPSSPPSPSEGGRRSLVDDDPWECSGTLYNGDATDR